MVKSNSIFIQKNLDDIKELYPYPFSVVEIVVQGDVHRGLFVGERTKGHIGEGLFKYDIRHSDDDWVEMATICPGTVIVNFCGSFFIDYKLPISDETDISDYGYL